MALFSGCWGHRLLMGCVVWVGLMAPKLYGFDLYGFDLYGFDLKSASAPGLFGQLLTKYVNLQGNVNYKAWQAHKADGQLLKDYLAYLAQNVPSTQASDAMRLAYYINLYNAATLDLVLAHYPIQSIRDINNGKPWDLSVVVMGDKRLSLDQLEHEIIRKQFSEPRIHFALVCAAQSCPQLRREPYSAVHLDAQLDNQAKIFLRDPQKNRPAQGQLSALFSWFEADFLQQASSISHYVQQFVSFSVPTQIRYLEYDWRLNSL